jgi:hypothetical protein
VSYKPYFLSPLRIDPEKKEDKNMSEHIRPEKKAWQKPEFIVLMRSKPEEAVLVVCKSPNSKFMGPNDPANKCKLRGLNCFVVASS